MSDHGTKKFMFFPFSGLLPWRLSLVQGVSRPSDAMGPHRSWTHVLLNVKLEYWVFALRNARWMSYAHRNARRTLTSFLKSVVQKSRKWKNKIEVIVREHLCWLGNSLSTKNQDQVDYPLNIFYTRDHLTIRHQYVFSVSILQQEINL